ncbi:HNH endonuclease [Gordonia phage Horus]|uniref:HNH endonuclease n=1 Tax=Gordonia phage Horus TaxID=2301696 RepID=A0A385DWZ0_9CAUD|nr:HNH endonuclease [Gordonia phage Horus]AXQ63941.1 HNH endonuclease [Gordonia phage Horus]QYC53754.1 HNH endonuclease [Gordonia phage Leroy]UTN91551.1 HNH endonuclease [Gordonia phage Periwinkle]
MTVSKRVRYEVFRRDNNRCRYCGATAPETPMTIDHVVPTALGGSDDPSNLVTACRDCNAGKTSSSPDAPLVADVADDAIRWANAMKQAAAEFAHDRDARAVDRDEFLGKWETWRYKSSGKYRTYELPGGWGESIDQFLAAGLSMVDLHDLVDVAMGAQSYDPWKYFCGCCWRRINQLQERASEIAKDAVPSTASSTDDERWPARYVRWYATQAVIKLAAWNGSSYSEEFAKLSCVHAVVEGDLCADNTCVVQAASRIYGYLEAGRHYEPSRAHDADISESDYAP